MTLGGGPGVARRQRGVRRARVRGLTPVLAALGGVGLVVGPFLPWYATDIGPPFEPEATSGWDATTLARAVVALGAIIALTALVLALDARGVVPLDAELARAAQWLLVASAAAAAALVAWRVVRLPEPSEFLAREIGLYVTAGAALLALVAAVAELRARS